MYISLTVDKQKLTYTCKYKTVICLIVTIFVPVYHASVVCASWQCAFATFTIKRYFISPLLESRLAFLVTYFDHRMQQL